MDDTSVAMEAAREAVQSGKWADLWAPSPGVVLLNHGSFGRAFTAVRVAQRLWESTIDRDPGSFYRDRHDATVRSAADAAAHWLKVPEDGTAAFAHNASTAILDAVVSFAGPGETVQFTSLGYGGVDIGLAHLAETIGIILEPITIDSFHDARDLEPIVLESVAKVRPSVLVLDQITSSTALRLPLESLLPRIREVSPSTRIVVDAAHAAGMESEPVVPGADAWITNLHKWVSAAPGTAVVVAPAGSPFGPALRGLSGLEPFPDSYRWTGTDAKASFLAAPVAFEIIDLLRAAGLDRRVRSTLQAAASFLSSEWDTPPDARPETVRCGWMGLIEVPTRTPIDPAALDRAMLAVREELQADVALTHFAGSTYLRLSAHAYNDPSQYERLTALPAVLAAVRG